MCDAAKDLLVDSKLRMKTAVIMSEDAAWTGPLDAGYMACLPKVGLNVLDHIRMSPDTTDFTPIFNGIEAKKPDVIVTGISHVGVQPTVQWANQQVPIPMFGITSQGTSSTFWKGQSPICGRPRSSSSIRPATCSPIAPLRAGSPRSPSQTSTTARGE